MHLTHIEDLVFEGKGNIAVRILQEVLKQNDQELHTTIKMDGKPAIIAGPDPVDGKFFIAKKSGIRNPAQRYKSIEQIKNSGLNQQLTSVLCNVFETLRHSHSRFNAVYQGDLLFSVEDQNIVLTTGMDVRTGDPCWMVTPNVVTYQLPWKTNMYPTVGIVFHTKYESHGTQLVPTLDPINLSLTDPYIYQIRNEVTLKSVLAEMSADDIDFYLDQLNVVVKLLQDADTIDVAQHPLLPQLVNDLVKNQQTNQSADFILDRYLAMIENSAIAHAERLKTSGGRARILEKGKAMSNDIVANKQSWLALLGAFLMLQRIKNCILVWANNPMTVTATVDYNECLGEGLVVIDKSTQTLVKLINRAEFSYRNFKKHGEVE